MARVRSVVFVLAAAALAWVGGVRPEAAKTDITTQADPTFAFAGLKTWAWHPDGAGDVRQAISAETDPNAIKKRVDPIIFPAVERELKARGFTKVDGPADLYVHYYVLATVNQMSQYMGQFVAPLPAWGLPPFAPVTTALEIYATGTLILDITSPTKHAIVWRGAAQRKIDLDKSEKDRRKILDNAVRDLLEKFPPPPAKNTK
jgi:hypothetical protein